MRLFLKDKDFEAFERIIEKTLESCPMRICAYCLLSNHWHFVLWPEHDGDLGAFMQKLTITHVRNWQENRRRVGYGHLYQGRYKSFPVETDDHFYQLVRYVERNALRANTSNAGGRLALVESLASRLRKARGSTLAQRLAVASTARLGQIRQGTTGRRGIEGNSSKRRWRSAVRRWAVGQEHGRTIGTPVHVATSRSAPQDTHKL